MKPIYHYSDSDLKLRDAAELIGNNMDWESTPEGQQYWHDVYYRLLSHSKGASLYPGHGVASGTGKPGQGQVTQTGFQERLVKVAHYLHKGYIACGLNTAKIPAGHTFITSPKEVDKVTCPLCKSKLSI